MLFMLDYSLLSRQAMPKDTKYKSPSMMNLMGEYPMSISLDFCNMCDVTEFHVSGMSISRIYSPKCSMDNW